MGKKLVLAIALLIIVMLLPGCWDRREAEQLGIVVGLGLDLTEDGQIQTIVQTVLPRQPGAGGSGVPQQETFYNWVGSGSTVFESIRNLTMQSPNPLYFPHNQVIIISEKLARQGLMEVMDFLERDPEIKQSTWVLIGQGNLQELMQTTEAAMRPPAQILGDIIKIRDRNAKYAISNLGDFLQRLDDPNTEAYTAGVTYFRGTMKDKNQKSVPFEKAARGYETKIQKTAVFHRDKLVGWLNDVESRGLLWVRGEVSSGIVVVKTKDSKYSMEVLKSSAKIKPLIRDGQLVMKIDVKVDLNIGEASSIMKVLSEGEMLKLEKQTGDKVKQEILAAIVKCQQLNSDVLGFGQAVYQQYPNLWKRDLVKSWPETFKELEVEVNVESHLRRTGMISITINPNKKP